MSALSKRLDKLEEMLASRLSGPTIFLWIKEGETLAEVVAEKILAGEIPPNARAQGIAGWRERRGLERPGPLVRGARWLDESEAKLSPVEPAPKQIAPPLKRLEHRPDESEQQLATEADPPSDNPYARRRAVVLTKAKGDFHKPIAYPRKTGAA